jgi:hypothetical protein
MSAIEKGPRMTARFERDSREKRSGRIPEGRAHARKGSLERSRQLEPGTPGAEREPQLDERSEPKAKRRTRIA